MNLFFVGDQLKIKTQHLIKNYLCKAFEYFVILQIISNNLPITLNAKYLIKEKRNILE